MRKPRRNNNNSYFKIPKSLFAWSADNNYLLEKLQNIVVSKIETIIVRNDKEELCIVKTLFQKDNRCILLVLEKSDIMSTIIIYLTDFGLNTTSNILKNNDLREHIKQIYGINLVDF